MTFHQLVKRLHPDANGGDGSKTIEFTELMRLHRGECYCGCGRQRPVRNRQFYNALCRLRSRYPPLKALAVVILVIACLGAGLPPMPPVKNKVQRLHSPRGEELYSAVPMAVVLPQKSYSLFWNYPLHLPQPNLEFIIEMRPDFNSPWQVLGVTNLGSYPINTTTQQMMYRVGARIVK